MDIKAEVIAQFTQVAREQDIRLPPLTDDLPLGSSGLDSLSLAILVTRMETAVGVDPFSSDEDIRVPVTFGDFVKLYEDAAT
jgi:hypothetical protein